MLSGKFLGKTYLISTIDFLRQEILSSTIFNDELTTKLLDAYYSSTGISRTLVGVYYYDLTELNDAAYMYRIYTHNEIIQTGKFVVTK